jgi:hypothetical protein
LFIVVPKALTVKKIFDYFDTRYRAEMLGRPVDQTGPVITISRLTGCDGREVAAELVAQMNLKYNTNGGNGLTRISSTMQHMS